MVLSIFIPLFVAAILPVSAAEPSHGERLLWAVEAMKDRDRVGELPAGLSARDDTTRVLSAWALSQSPYSQAVATSIVAGVTDYSYPRVRHFSLLALRNAGTVGAAAITDRLLQSTGTAGLPLGHALGTFPLQDASEAIRRVLRFGNADARMTFAIGASTVPADLSATLFASLREAARHPDPVFRCEAVLALGSWRELDGEDWASVTGALSDVDPGVRACGARAMEGFAALSDDEVAGVVRVLNEHSSESVNAAGWILTDARARGAAVPLCEAVRRQDSELRDAAYGALGQVPPENVAALVDCLAALGGAADYVAPDLKSSLMFRENTVAWLLVSVGTAAVASLEELAVSSATVPALRVDLLRILVQIITSEGVAPNGTVIFRDEWLDPANPSNPARAQAAMVRRAILHSLGDEDPEVRLTATCLSPELQMRDPLSFDALERKLDDADERVARCALETLLFDGDRAAKAVERMPRERRLRTLRAIWDFSSGNGYSSRSTFFHLAMNHGSFRRLAPAVAGLADDSRIEVADAARSLALRITDDPALVLKLAPKALAGHEGARQSAFMALATVEAPEYSKRILSLLIGQLEAHDEETRRMAVWALSLAAPRAGPAGVSALSALFDQHHSAALETAVYTLRDISFSTGPPSSWGVQLAPYLQSSLSSATPSLRVSALRELGRLGIWNSDCDESLVALARSTDTDLRTHVAAAAKWMPDRPAKREILDRLARDPDDGVAQAANRARGKAGKKCAVTHSDPAEKGGKDIGQEFWDYCWMSDREAIGGLVELFADTRPFVADFARRHVEQFGSVAHEALVHALGHDSDSVKKHAAIALALTGLRSKRVLEVLVDGFRSDVRRGNGRGGGYLPALKAFGTGAVEAAPALLDVLALEAANFSWSQETIGVLAAVAPNSEYLRVAEIFLGTIGSE